MPIVNDIHSALNATNVAEIIRPSALGDVVAAVDRCRKERVPLCIAGGRHAMGGQQFREGGIMLDMTAMKRTIRFDHDRGLIEVEAGADWPAIIAATHAAQTARGITWGIRQKQTGVDAVTLGGTIACNAHGRGLMMQPIAADIEDITLVRPDGVIARCSREMNADLFSLVIGGYGLFGIVTSATLRLGKREKLQRIVDVIDIDDAMNAVRRRIADGCIYGDFQYAIDPADDSFLRRGVFACYRPAPDHAAVSDESADLSQENWLRLLTLTHTDKRRAFQEYSSYYVSTHGRVYWSDTMQLSTYIPSYTEFLSTRGVDAGSSLVIGELYVPPDRLLDFMRAARSVLRESGAEDIYGTIRSIRRDVTSFLPWAREDWACVIFNLRTQRSKEGYSNTAACFRMLIDAAAEVGGSFYLTYQRAATNEQVHRCHPRFGGFLQQKRLRDPDDLLQSEWWRHYGGGAA